MALFYQAFVPAFVGIFLVYAVNVVSRRLRMKGARTPPGPKGWPVVGNAPELASSNGNLIPIFNKWAEQYGPIAQFSILGEKQVVISDDKIAADLFVKRGSKYSGRGTPHAMAFITKDLNPALMPKNEAWRRGRRLIHSAISITTNEKYQCFMNEEAIITLKHLAETPSDFTRHFLRYSYGVLTRSILGFSVSSAEDPFIVRSEYIINEGMKCFRPDCYPSNVFPFLRAMPTWLVPSLKTLNYLRDVAAKTQQDLRRDVETSIKQGTARDSIFRHFLENRSEYDIGDEEAAYTFDSMIGGGTRSPYNGILSFCYLMMEYPEWMAKLQEQVDKVVGPDRLPAVTDIPNLPIVRALVVEGIRYRSIVAELGIPHRLDEDDVYEGYFFPKGTVFHANFGRILMDKKMYPDQLPFNPARWLDPSYPTYKEPLTIYPNCQGYTPFGYGRRACPGYDFAERTLNIIVAQLAWAFDVRKPMDPATGRPVKITMQYEPNPNPSPLPFPCEIVPRSAQRIALVEREAAKL